MQPNVMPKAPAPPITPPQPADPVARVAVEADVSRCPRTDSNPMGRGVAKHQYAISEPEVWDPALGTLTRSGLCVHCDAAIYQDRKGQYWHAGPDAFFYLRG